MADRKVLVKYYPPDFDPEKLREKSRLYRRQTGKRQKGGVKQMNVRFMFPFTMCCGTCAEFIYIGTKFNSRVERIQGEDYLGIAIWRFFGRCPHCRAEIGFKTDPKNTEYVLEFGGTRTYDPRKDAELAAASVKEKLEEEIATDTMFALEHKTYNTANELMALEQLDELRKINKRLLNRESTVEDALGWLQHGGLEKEIKQETLSDELDVDELADLERAKEEMSKKQLQSLNSSSSSDDDIHQQATTSSNDIAPSTKATPPTSTQSVEPTRPFEPKRPIIRIVRKKTENNGISIPFQHDT